MKKIILKIWRSVTGYNLDGELKNVIKIIQDTYEPIMDDIDPQLGLSELNNLKIKHNPHMKAPADINTDEMEIKIKDIENSSVKIKFLICHECLHCLFNSTGLVRSFLELNHDFEYNDKIRAAIDVFINPQTKLIIPIKQKRIDKLLGCKNSEFKILEPIQHQINEIINFYDVNNKFIDIYIYSPVSIFNITPYI